MSTNPVPATDIDNTDFAILFSVENHDVPPWKNKIHGWVVDQEENLPIANSVSVQTVGRRVDTLVNEDFLETVIVSPEDIKRDLIIAFKLTEKGKDAITGKREQLLKETVQNQIFAADDGNNISKGALITLLLDKFNWDGDMYETLHQKYGKNELSTFLVMVYIEEEASSMIDAEQVKRFKDVLTEYNDMADELLDEAGKEPEIMG